MSGLNWREARLSEYLNRGPGAAVNNDRPQLTREQAEDFDPEDYLRARTAGTPSAASSHSDQQLGRQALPKNDGWAAAGTGTTGGSAARPENIHTVSTRAQLLAAIGDPADNTPKIIYVKGAIDADTDDAGNPSPARATRSTATASRRTWPPTTRRSGAGTRSRQARWRTRARPPTTRWPSTSPSPSAPTSPWSAWAATPR
nr:hypothetical protein GCM10020093_050720 [Planobispora longispora]